MAVHFDANFQPNGSLAKRGFEVGLGIVGVMLDLPTVVTADFAGGKAARVMDAVVISYFVSIFLWYGNYSIDQASILIVPATAIRGLVR